jgi:Lipocalin-like domain
MNMDKKVISMAALIALTTMGFLTGCGSSVDGGVDGGSSITVDKLAKLWTVTKLSGYGQSVTCPGVLIYPLDAENKGKEFCGDPKVDPDQLDIDSEVQGARRFTLYQGPLFGPVEKPGRWELNGNTLTFAFNSQITFTAKVFRLTDKELVLEWNYGGTIVITKTYAVVNTGSRPQ